MAYQYYLDESGHSGNLVKAGRNLAFGGQPLFALACFGIENEAVLAELANFVAILSEKHGLSQKELKSKDVYFKNPGVIFELASFIAERRLPFLVELVDKKYCVALSILTNQILPAYSLDISKEETDLALNVLADYLAKNLPQECFEKFLRSCEIRSEESLLASMYCLLDFFSKANPEDKVAPLVAKSVAATAVDYNEIKGELGQVEAVEKFLPIPDISGSGDFIQLLPHVHSMYNLFARLNKYHRGDMSEIRLWHDDQEELQEVLTFCAKNIADPDGVRGLPNTQHADFKIRNAISLDFAESRCHIGVQVADILAGFYNRYVNGLVYKNVEIPDIYHHIFYKLKVYNTPMGPLGVNFVLPQSRRAIIFEKFSM